MRGIFLTFLIVLFIPATPRADEMAVYDPFAKERFMVRARALAVFPDEGQGGVNIGGRSDVGNALTPEIDLTYFITDHIAAELIAATAQHEIGYTGDVNLGKTWILPPTLTLQYHFTPRRVFSPYLGAGLNYSVFYGEETGTGFTGLEVEGGLGYALQAGADFWLNDHWGLNVDLKRIWLDVEGTLNGGAITTDIDLDPWIAGAGISYRF
jgi:outer membrane protein